MSNWFAKQLGRIGLADKQAEELASATPSSGPISILLVDDTPANIQVLMETLKPLGHKLLAAKDGEAALAIAKRSRPDLILLDIMMPGIDGFEVCRRLKADPDLAQAAVIFCSAMEDTASKVKGLQLGAVDFVTKPFEPEEVVARVGTHLAIQQLARSLGARNRSLARELAVAQAGKQDALRRVDWMLLGGSEAMQEVKTGIAEAAADAAPALLRSPSNCGAEAIARAIHEASPRRAGAFIAIDCVRLAATTAGLDGPAFSLGGEVPSRLELADGGTLFIEQIDRLAGADLDQFATWVAAATAAREAGRKPVPDVRVIAVTGLVGGKSLPETFSSALTLELTSHLLPLPGLAERRPDILPLASEILARQCRSLGRKLKGFDPASVKHLQAHEWPGNLRELEDVVARSVVATPASAHMATVDPALLQSGIALGSYRLTRKLGAGGFGEVWEGRHQMLARPAAIKLILSEAASAPDTVERFRREATATASLSSPHTVTLYDFGVSEQGQFYYVMEMLDGFDLEHYLGKHGTMPPSRLVHFLIHACRSLVEAHAAGLVHRDLKPSNMYACRLGLEVDVLKILDFGLVRQSGANQPRLTQADLIVGTPDFIAPECAMGKSDLDGRTDIYSLAATAYNLAAGKSVFTGANPMVVVMQHIQAKPVPLVTVAPGVPQGLSDLIMACLAKSPADRPDAQVMLAALLSSGLAQQWSETDRQDWWAQHRPAKKA